MVAFFCKSDFLFLNQVQQEEFDPKSCQIALGRAQGTHCAPGTKEEKAITNHFCCCALATPSPGPSHPLRLETDNQSFCRDHSLNGNCQLLSTTDCRFHGITSKHGTRCCNCMYVTTDQDRAIVGPHALVLNGCAGSPHFENTQSLFY